MIYRHSWNSGDHFIILSGVFLEPFPSDPTYKDLPASLAYPRQSIPALSRFWSCKKTIPLTRLHSQLKSFHLRREDNCSPGALSHHRKLSLSLQKPSCKSQRKANVVLCSWANYLYPSGIKICITGSFICSSAASWIMKYIYYDRVRMAKHKIMQENNFLFKIHIISPFFSVT